MSYVYKKPYVYLQIQHDWYRYNASNPPLGSGAMGTVYLGEDCVSHRRVAIKMVHAQYADIPSIRQRAYQEAALRFMHAHLIEMLGVCEEHEGRGALWIVSKFVQGITIDKFVANMSPDFRTVNKVCELFYPVLDALSYLHSRNILHLDIKPTNIMVENGCNVRLMDLGIAADQHGTTLGSQGMMGTPNYAAPEQFEANGIIDHRSDIYEAAVTLYELLTGVNPYASKDTAETIRRHKQQLLTMRDGLTPAVLDVLCRAAHPVRYQRYDSVTEFCNALREACTAPPPSFWSRLFHR